METMDWPRLKPYVDLYSVPVIRVLSVAPGRFRVDSPVRMYEARVVPHASAQVRMRLTDDLARRGFRNTQRFLLNHYHDRVVAVNDKSVLYMTDYGNGAALQVTPEDVRSAVVNLVELHRSMDGYGQRVEDARSKVKQRHGTWERSLEQGEQWIATERILARSREQSEPTRLLQSWLQRWEEQAGAAREALHNAGYREFAAIGERRGDTAWNGYRLDALVRRPSGRLYTRQLRDPVGDHRLYDLATLCHEVCLAGHADGVEEAIAAYTSQRPLSNVERQVVRAFAAYPHHALALLRQGRTERNEWLQNEDWQVKAQRHLDAATALLSRHR